MKRQHYVIPVLMLLAGAAWGDGYRNYSPYGAYGNPYNANAPSFYGYQGHYPEPSYNPYTSRRYANPYAADSIHTPYSDSPNPYSTYGSPYHPNPAINPYFPNPINHPYGAHSNHRPNPYGGYENPYHQSPAIYPYATDAQQLYRNHGYYQGTLSTPNSIPPPYGNGNNRSPLFEQ
jgi:hypothetical protein